MDFLENIDKLYISLVIGIVYIIGEIIVQRKKSLKLTLKYRLTFYVIVIGIITISIPHVFLGFPYDISDLENKKMILYHLQTNNEALVRMTEAFREMFFITNIFAFSIIMPIIKYLKIDKTIE
jgi:hypothetical protein